MRLRDWRDVPRVLGDRLGRARVPGLVAAAVCMLALPVIGSPASAASGCSRYALHDVVAAASGVRVVQIAKGVTLVEEADGSGPEAQAMLHSVFGSIGWAGAPYSNAVAGNAGAVRMDPNDVPVFVVSSHPTNPEPEPKSTPAGTLRAESGIDFSKASFVGGGPSSDEASAAHIRTSADVLCETDGTVKAVADSIAEGVTIAGVLRFGSVSSHAEIIIDPNGTAQLAGTMHVEAATVLGQPVAFTDEGLVIGSPATPGPDNPLQQALADAGVSVQYVSAEEDEQDGEVFAPGVEVIVSREVPGVGAGAHTTTYTFGRAYARGIVTQGGPGLPVDVPATTPVPPAPPSAPTLESFDVPDTPGATAPTPNAPTPLAAPTPSSTTRIASWSIAPAYYALALGALALLTVRLLSVRLRERFTWT